MGLLHALDDMGHPPGVGRRSEEAADSPDGVTAASNAHADTAQSAPRSEDKGNGGAGLASVVERLSGLVRRKTCPKGKRQRWSVWRVAAIAVLTYVAAINLSYFFVLKPVWSQLDGLVSKKSIIQDFLVVRESASAVSEFRDALMRGDQRVTVMADLKELAEQAGLRVVDEPELGAATEMSAHIMEYSFEMELSGDYHDIGRFLAMVEESPRALITKSVEIESDESNPGRQTARIELGAASWED